MDEKQALMFIVLVSLPAVGDVQAQVTNTDAQSIPQNAMSARRMRWFSVQRRVVVYTMYPLPQGKIIHCIG